MISTFYDWHFRRSKENKQSSKEDKPSSIDELATLFSFLKSHEILFKTNVKRFECIDTVRFCASILVYLTHYYLILFSQNPAARGFLDEDGVAKRFYDGDWRYLILRNRQIVDIHFAIRFIVESLKKVYSNFLLILFQWFTFNI